MSDDKSRCWAKLKNGSSVKIKEALLRALPDLMFLVSPQGIILDFNIGDSEGLLSVPKEKIIGLSIDDLGFDEKTKKFLSSAILQVEQKKKEIEVIEYNLDVITKKAGVFEARIVRVETGKVLVIVRDMTDKHQAITRQKLATDILGILNASSFGDSKGVIKEILRSIKNYVVVDAVAIRLKKGKDYPYYEYDGFSDQFIQQEDSVLCSECDIPSHTSLECRCGRVLCGDTDETLKYYTHGGSFWTNELQKLFKNQEKTVPNIQIMCDQSGYQSVALIPLKSNGEISGLLQLNAKRKNVFNVGLIEFFEELGASIGISIKRMEFEEQIQGSLKEKEVLIREIHHRVKNNLQVMQSMFNVQADYVQTKEAKEILHLSVNRIQLMALVYSELYQTENFSEIQSHEYLGNVVDSLLAAYNIKPSKIHVSKDIEPTSTNIRVAVSSGLIINELVTNVFKHAFPMQRSGELFISWKRIKGDRIELIVRDNGIGMSEGFDIIGSGSFGLYLVVLLVQQLEGEIELELGEFTEFRIEFPLGVDDED